MPDLSLNLVLTAAAAIAIGTWLCGGDDDTLVLHYSYRLRPRSTTRIQTQPSHRPPPLPQPPSYTYRPPATYPQITPRAPAPPDNSRGVDQPRVVPPYTRTPSQTQPSSTLTQQSSARTPPSTHAQPSSTLTHLSSTLIHPPLAYSSLLGQIRALSSFSTLTQLSFTLSHTPLAYSSLLEQIRGRSASTSCRVPSCVPAESESRLLAAPAAASPRPSPDKPAAVEGLGFAKKLREKAQRRRLEMMEAYSRAKSAQMKASRGATQERKHRANAHKSGLKELNKRAAEIIFREKNKNRKGGIIDLHGLYVTEAIRIARVQVQAARSRGDKVVHFIVGKGLHADDGEAKIRPALQGLFTKQGLTHSLDPKNSGVLVVQL